MNQGGVPLSNMIMAETPAPVSPLPEHTRPAGQDAEERAGKVGVKLVFPIFFFILPSMLVVAAGPGLLQVFKNLFPMMRSFGQ